MSSKKSVFVLVSLIFLSMLPVTMVVPVIKDIVKDRMSAGNLESALFTSLSMLGSFLFSPVAGYLSDKLQNRKTIITLACLLDSVLFYLMTLIYDIHWFLFLRFVEGAVHIFIIGLLLSSVSDQENHPESSFYKMGKLMGIAGMFLSLGAAIGMPLGGIGKVNPLLPFYFGSILFLFIAVISFLFLKDTIHKKEDRFHFQDFVKSLSLNPYLTIPFIFHFIDRFTVGYIISSFNLHLRENLHFTPGLAGLYMGLVLLLMSILSYPSALIARRKGSFPMVLGGSLVYGIFLALTGWVENRWMLLSVLVIAGMGAGMMYVPSMILASRMSPKGFNATVMSAFTGLGSLGFMAGPIASVFLQDSLYHFFPSYQIIGILSFIFGFLEVILVLLTVPFWKKSQLQIS